MAAAPSDSRPPCVAIATGTGRCGTQFLYRIMDLEPAVAAHHEREPMSDAFHRYCQWNRLPVDHGGFLSIKEAGVRSDFGDPGCRVSFESSAYLALSLRELHERLAAHWPVRFVLLLRRPDQVVESYRSKGLYARDVDRIDPSRPAGFQRGMKYDHHPFSRIVPFGPDGTAWSTASVTGRLAWFCRVINSAVLDTFATLPDEQKRIVKLEDLDHSTYCSLATFLGFEPTVTAARYDAIASERPNTLRPSRTVHDWSAQEIEEFEREVRPYAERVGYPWAVSELREMTPRAAAATGDPPDARTRMSRLLRKLGKKA